MIIIRKAVTDDKHKIQEIIKNTDFNQFDFNKHPEHTMVVELEHTIIGCATLDICGNLAHIGFVYIIPSYQNQGLGDGLVRALINYADRRNVKKIYIFYDKKVDYFKRFGFKYITSNKCDNKIYETSDINISKHSFIMELDVNEFFNNCQCH
ncbi:MAG: GNAT family N-acetyltransferase [Thermoanaerobacteraceae bacterium]|nr:GNAT family N-acetyltransferase [Thermoanaerobacteraceae bacterium]